MKKNATHHILVRNFTMLSETELLMILERRNHPDVRKWMVNTDPIAPEEHLRYCASLKDRPEILQLFVEFDGKPACVLSYKATDSSWHKLADSGIYAFDPEPCSSSILSNIISWHIIAKLDIKESNIMVRNENEMAIFANQYYHGCHVVAQDEHYTYMKSTIEQPASFYLAQAEQKLKKLDAALELRL